MELQGKIHEISALQQVSETFKKRDLVIEYAENAQYPEYIKFEALQDKCSLFDSLKVGDNIEVAFNLRGRPWTDKSGKVSYFNSLVVWRLSQLGKASSTPEYAPPVDLNSKPDDDNSDLPF